MIKLKLMVGLAMIGIAFALSACGGLQAVVPGSVRLPADQALAVAEAGADGVNGLATGAASTLDDQRKAEVKAGIDATNNAVSAAHDAYVKGDLATTTADLQSAMANIATLETELKK
jgi:hypothetical protein